MELKVKGYGKSINGEDAVFVKPDIKVGYIDILDKIELPKETWYKSTGIN